MANIKSNQKSIRKTAARTERNRQVNSRLKTLTKKVDQLVASGDTDEAKTAAIELVSAFDKAAKRGIIHHNKANRRKSAMAKVIQA